MSRLNLRKVRWFTALKTLRVSTRQRRLASVVKWCLRLTTTAQKKQEFKFGQVTKLGSEYVFQATGSNALSYSAVLHADNATVYLNNTGNVCWTPEPRLLFGAGNPTIADKKNVNCIADIDTDKTLNNNDW